MNSEAVSDRPFDRDFYQDFQKKDSSNSILSRFPATWDEFRLKLRAELPAAPSITDNERAALWQAGAAFRVGCGLIQEGERESPFARDVPKHGVQTAALQLILYGVFVQLRSWEHKLQVAQTSDNLLSELIKFLNSEELQSLRNALAHNGDDNGATFFRFDAATQSVIYSTRKLREQNKQGQLSLNHAVFAAFLWWVVFSEWSLDAISSSPAPLPQVCEGAV
jgi:hypothetical protein